MKKQLLILSIFLFTITAFSQYNLNDYKYVVIPRKFDFLKQTDQYQLNSMTKFLLEKENFTVYFDDQNLPKDLATNRCLALYGDVLDGSKLFKTKLSVIFKDCNNQVVFTTQEGESKEKNFQKAYYEALREAFQSFQSINHSYQPKQIEEKAVEVVPKPELKEDVKVVKEPVSVKAVKKEEKKPIAKPKLETSNMLYAQKIDGGYQVVDSTPKVVMILMSTPLEDVYLVKDKNEIVFKQDGFWHKSNGENSMDSLNIKF